jgi:hypothetical protein
MKLFEELDENNFILFASRNYNNPQCTSIEEFYDDIQRFKYIKKLLNRYEKTKDLNERLIINHIVILYNIFGIQSANRMMFYKLEPEYWPMIKPFLVYLNLIKENEYVDVTMDTYIIDTLRKL